MHPREPNLVISVHCADKLLFVSGFDSQDGRRVPPDELSMAEREADDADVVQAVQGLAGIISQGDDLEAVLLVVAEFAVSATPNADGAGVTLMRTDADADSAVLAWATTRPFVREIDRLQYDVCHEGPCLTAMQTRRPLISGSLGSDERWRRFGGRVARLDVHSALAVPLVVNDAVVGALNIYARQRDAFTEHAVRLAMRFSLPAAVSVSNIQVLHDARTRAAQLQSALTTRAVIDQAIGILRSRSGGSAEEAFDRLRQTSQHENVKLAVIAERLVEQAVRRAHARNVKSDRA